MVSTKSEIKFLSKHSSIFAVGNFLTKIVSFLLLPIYTRYLTPYDYGIKELVGLTVDVTGILLAMTISSAVMRFYFEYDDTKNRNEVISTAMIIIGSVGIAACALVSFGTDLLAKYLLDNSELGYFFLIAFISMIFGSVNGVSYDYLRANQKSLRYITYNFVKLILGVSLNIYMICFLRLGVVSILLTNLILSVMIFLTLTLPVLRMTGLHLSIAKVKEMAKFGFPLTLSQLGAFVVHLSDRFFMKALWSVSDAGLYSLGYRFGTLPGVFVSGPFNKAWQPRRFELLNKPDSEIIFGRVFTYYLLFLFFCGMSVAVLTKDVLKIMATDSFWSAYQVVPIIVLANIIFNSSTHVNMGLLITKKTKYFALINGTNALLVLCLNFILIRAYGAYGAAVATLIAFVYKISLTYYFSSRYYKIYFEFRRILKILAAATTIYLLSLVVETGSPIINMVIKTSMLGFFPILLYWLKFPTEKEKHEIFAVIKSRLTKLRNNRAFGANQ
jgi:O-antigen/teichoic acid export membrane protein